MSPLGTFTFEGPVGPLEAIYKPGSGKPERAAMCDCDRSNTPTLLQAIFLQNDPVVKLRLERSGWLEDVARQHKAGAGPDTATLIRLAYLRTVSRPPTTEETARARQYVEAAESLEGGLRDLLWALINTKEFVLNH